MAWGSTLRSAGLGLLLTAIGGAASAKAFDLQCGKERYRIDLKSKTWCEADCLSRSRLLYNGERTVLLMWQEHFGLSYDLRTKVLKFGYDGPGLDPEVSREKCRVRKFSGFPDGH